MDLSKIVLRTNPTYTYNYNDGSPKSITSNYTIVGYTMTPNGQTLRYMNDYSIGTSDFGDQQSLRIYAAWAPEYILEFSSDPTYYDSGDAVGYMRPRKLSECTTAPAPTFNSPKGSTDKYHYYNSSLWEDTSSYSRGSVNWYRFTNWDCAIGNKKYTLREGDPLSVHVFNIDEPPVMRMCAYWERAYDKISFMVGEEKYCDVCIDNRINRVEYPPHDPVIVQTEQSKLTFQGWDVANGDYLPGVDRSEMVICKPDTESQSETIICGEDT